MTAAEWFAIVLTAIILALFGLLIASCLGTSPAAPTYQQRHTKRRAGE